MKCKDCRYCFTDKRPALYRRPVMFFCRKKGALFSRGLAVGQGNRVDGEAFACPMAEQKADSES